MGAGPAGDQGKGRVLVVDDEPKIVSAVTRLLKGYEVSGTSDSREAIGLLRGRRFDAVVSDLRMPDVDGLTLLKRIREVDADMPVLLMTGAPTLETAVEAVALGATRYLTKPVSDVELLEAVQTAVRLRRLAELRQEAVVLLTRHQDQERDLAGLMQRFHEALDQAWIAFQPVARVSNGSAFGWEALVRSTAKGMESPAALFEAAAKLRGLSALGRRIRRLVAEAIEAVPESTILVNVHPDDLADDDLYDANAPLSKHAKRIFLEITERASLDEVAELGERVRRLRSLGYRLAIDDIGAGYAGLGSFALLGPELVKLDMLFTRGIPADARRQQLVRSIVAMCNEMGVPTIIEGVERADERDTLRSLGCDLMQGYLFAKPAKGFPKPAF